MSAQAHMNGTRLAFVVVPQEGTVRRPVHRMPKNGGVVKVVEVEEPAGYLAYFPRGHVIRLKDRKELRRYGLDGDAPFINLQGLNDPRSPIGKMMMGQDEETRRNGFQALEKHVMQLAQAKSGRIEVTEDAIMMDEYTREDA